jgi:hypothetical protein
VTGVQFRLDGGNLGVEDTSAPYAISWDTRTVPNGTHGLSAIARDAAGNVGTAANVQITVSNQAPSPTGLVGSYAWREGAGTRATDGSGWGNHGTLTNGPTWIAGKYGNAVHFDGTDDHIAVPDAAALDLGSSGTIEAWVKLDRLNRWHGIVAKGNANSNPAHNYALEVNSGNRFQCILGNGSSHVSAIATTSVTTGQFVHVACVWNGAALQLYLNGALNVSVSTGLAPAANTAPLWIGQFGGNKDRLAGTIDEVRIYNRALSAAEIQTDMNTPL